MTLHRFRSEGFRNLDADEITLSPGLNLVSGANGAGKTSLLEAIYFLSRVRSFRTRKARDLVQTGCNGFMLGGSVIRASGRSVTIGLQREGERTRLRIGGEDCNDIAELSALLPLQILTTESHQLVTGGPSNRRRFLDWGVFHVEHGYLGIWQRYTRALRQRNAAIRARAPAGQISAWDHDLAETAGVIDQLRRRFLGEYQAPLDTQSDRLLPGKRILIQYRRGWDDAQDFGSTLAENLEGDRRHGFTRSGPHRADLQILLDERPARDWLSRGQQRQLVITLLLGQTRLLAARSGRAGLFLLDDLAAELDQTHRHRVLSALAELGCQTVVSVIDPADLDLSGWQEARGFHVEHGHLSEVI